MSWHDTSTTHNILEWDPISCAHLPMREEIVQSSPDPIMKDGYLSSIPITLPLCSVPQASSVSSGALAKVLCSIQSSQTSPSLNHLSVIQQFGRLPAKYSHTAHLSDGPFYAWYNEQHWDSKAPSAILARECDIEQSFASVIYS